MPTSASPTAPKIAADVAVDLALQGGGAHGAFTWGVLDRLLEEPWLQDRRHLRHLGRRHERRGAGRRLSPMAGRHGARAALERSGQSVSRRRALQPVPARPARRAARPLDARPFADVHRHGHDGAAVLALRSQPAAAPIRCATSWSSTVDFERLAQSPIKLFVTATNVRTGRGRVFRNAEITPDVLLASACLPTMFQAVEIDGEPYWDGGYSGNPTMTPLVRECDVERHHPGPDQSGRAAGHAALGARHPRPAQRGVVQRGAAEGAAHDRAAAPGGGRPATAKARSWAEMRIHHRAQRRDGRRSATPRSSMPSGRS